VTGLLERAAGIEPGDSAAQKVAKVEAMAAPHAADLGEAVALLAPLLGVGPGGGLPELDLPSDRRRQRTLEVLLEQFEGLATERPLVCVYEDAHWMDPSTLELVSMVIERIQRLRALVVVTYRPEFTPPWSGHAHVTHLSLGRLTRRHATALIGELTGGKRLPDDVLASIAQRTDGVPLFLEELTRTVLEAGALRDRGDRFELDGPLPSLAIPTTLQDSLMARLDRSAAAKEVAQLAAVIGREFSYHLLAAAAALEAQQLRRALDQLVASGLVFRRGSNAYAFKHALVQDAAYRSLLRRRRQELHGRTAECLERHFSGIAAAEPELVAHHLTEAGLTERAVEAWLAAGLRAIERSAHHEAVSHLRRSLDLLGGLPATEDRARRELQVQLALGGRALLATKGFADTDVAAACSRAEGLARQLGDDRQLAWALRGLCYVHHVRGQLDRSYGLKQDLLELADRLDDPMFTADARNAVAFSEYHLGLYRETHANLEISHATIERFGLAVRTATFGVNVAVFNSAYRGHTAWQLGRPDTALHIADEAIDLAGRLAQPFSTVVALDYAAMLHQFRGEPARTRERAEAALAVSNERGFAYYRAWATILLGWAMIGQDELEEGVGTAERGLRDLRATGAELRVPYYLGLLADALGRIGRAAAAEAALDEAFETARRNGEARTEPELHLVRAKLLGADRPEEAEASIRRAIATAERQGGLSLALRARVRLARMRQAQGRALEAKKCLAQCYGAFSEGFETPDLIEARRLLDEIA
jgi:tetratricopeptide (TPR) repeat protein